MGSRRSNENCCVVGSNSKYSKAQAGERPLAAVAADCGTATFVETSYFRDSRTGPRPNNKNCCVVGCNSKYSNSPGISFFSFPSRPWEKQRRERWIQLVRRQNEDGTDWRPSKNSRICSKHFVGNTKASEQNHPSYYPSIFPSVYKRKRTPGPYIRDRKTERKMSAAETSQDPPQHPDSPVPTIHYFTEHDSEITPLQCGLIDASTATEDQTGMLFLGELSLGDS